MYLLTPHTKGISSLQLSRDLGITQKSAWFVNHRIREMLKDKAPHMLLDNMVEVDEVYLGGADKNRYRNKKKSTGSGMEDKTPVLGLLERDNKVVTQVVSKAIGDVLIPIIHKKVAKSATIVTDCFGGYNKLGKDYNHIAVNHTAGEYKQGKYHTNTLEGFWGILKRGIYGIYHSISVKHTDRYLTEFTQRYNTRDLNEIDRFNSFLSKCEGRLKYNTLIN